MSFCCLGALDFDEMSVLLDLWSCMLNKIKAFSSFLGLQLIMSFRCVLLGLPALAFDEINAF